jgi:hypothetical protein
VTALDDLNDALREIVGPFLRKEGFRGSGQTWRLKAPNCDVAVVSVQRSKFSTRDHVQCLVALAVVPEVWWQWERDSPGGATSTQPSTAHAFYIEGLGPKGTAEARPWWHVTRGTDAELAALDMVTQLRETGLPALRHLLNREAMIDALRSGDFGEAPRFERALAVLLSDYGPSPELEQLLTRIEASAHGPHGLAAEDLVNWARQHAASTGDQKSCTPP